MSAGRRLAAALGGLVAALCMVGALLVAQSSSTPAAAHLAGFDPGNIISDGVFFDSSTASAADIQNFLNAKGSRCSGNLCLKNYAEATNTRAADTRCPGTYAGGGVESAAWIIYKVSQACGINPQVLLVTLQKEQGLVTSTTATVTTYRKAMGYGCPDTSACDALYYGFFNQVYSAARQFQNYRANPANYKKRAGLTNTISYHPATEAANNLNDWRCGTAQVYIKNQATAGLYNYTPYLPNAAAMASKNGDSCSAFGNRNFYDYFTDWFGSTQSSRGSQIVDKYQSTGGSTGLLGAVSTPINCGLVQGGCWQGYTHGSIYWSPATGAHFVKGGILDVYAAQGWERGGLGYPVQDEHDLTGGTYSMFAGGSIYWSPTAGTHIVAGDILKKWGTVGWEKGPLGWPTTDQACVPGGCFTHFQGGSIYWSPTAGTHIIKGAIMAKWGTTRWEAGVLGWPTTDETCVVGGCFNRFQGGAIYWSPTNGAFAVKGAILDRWASLGGATGRLGFPISDEQCVRGGCSTTFRGGTVFWSPTGGTRWMDTAMTGRFTALGGTNTWGFPTSDQLPLTGGAYVFLGVDRSLYWSPAGGAHVVKGAIYSRWATAGWENSALGFPVTDEKCVIGGCYLDFQGGTVSWSPGGGARVVAGDILQAWVAAGRETGGLGFPISEQTCAADGCWQNFRYGTITSTTDQQVHVVKGAIFQAWVAAGREGGALGHPTSDETCVVGGCYTEFEGGTVYWSPTGGTRTLTGDVLAAYVDAGGPTSSLGFPKAAATTVPGGQRLECTGGALLVAPDGSWSIASS